MTVLRRGGRRRSRKLHGARVDMEVGRAVAKLAELVHFGRRRRGGWLNSWVGQDTRAAPVCRWAEGLGIGGAQDAIAPAKLLSVHPVVPRRCGGRFKQQRWLLGGASRVVRRSVMVVLARRSSTLVVPARVRTGRGRRPGAQDGAVVVPAREVRRVLPVLAHQPLAIAVGRVGQEVHAPHAPSVHVGIKRLWCSTQRKKKKKRQKVTCCRHLSAQTSHQTRRTQTWSQEKWLRTFNRLKMQSAVML